MKIKKEQGFEMLLQGKHYTEVAKALGVYHITAAKWQKSPEFLERLGERSGIAKTRLQAILNEKGTKVVDRAHDLGLVSKRERTVVDMAELVLKKQIPTTEAPPIAPVVINLNVPLELIREFHERTAPRPVGPRQPAAVVAGELVDVLPVGPELPGPDGESS